MLDLTIAIPIKNEEDKIKRTIESVVKHSPCRILICDNASSDNSLKLCEFYQEKYDNISIISNPYDIGIVRNFELGLMLSTTKYFAWIGGHDEVSCDYYHNLILELEKNNKIVLAFGDYSGSEGVWYSPEYSQLLESENPHTRMLAFMQYVQSGSMFHGVYKTEDLKKAWVMIPSSLKTDPATLLQLLYLGKFKYCKHSTFITGKVRNVTPKQKSKRYQFIFYPSSQVQYPKTNWKKLYTYTQFQILENAECCLPYNLKIGYSPYIKYRLYRVCKNLYMRILGSVKKNCLRIVNIFFPSQI